MEYLDYRERRKLRDLQRQKREIAKARKRRSWYNGSLFDAKLACLPAESKLSANPTPLNTWAHKQPPKMRLQGRDKVLLKFGEDVCGAIQGQHALTAGEASGNGKSKKY